jgi:hypothetical protein
MVSLNLEFWPLDTLTPIDFPLNMLSITLGLLFYIYNYYKVFTARKLAFKQEMKIIFPKKRATNTKCFIYFIKFLYILFIK